jgi:hypothetical protein
MTITATQSNAQESTRVAQGSHLDDAGSPDAISVTVGFTPRYVQVVNQTTRVTFEWYEGMTAAHAVKTIANGTRSAETSGGITVSGGTITMPAPAQNDQIRWVARS